MVEESEPIRQDLAMTDLIKVKSALRKTTISRRDAMVHSVRTALSCAIVQQVACLAPYRQASVVMAYANFGSELQTEDFLHQVLDHGKTLVLPKVNREKKFLDLYEVRDLARDLEPGTWSIPEPKVDLCVPVELGAVNFALLPGAAFDTRGGRLGYGAGFYDKLLGSCAERPYLVAGAFETQMIQEVPLDQHDVLVDLIVTESRTYP